MGQGKRNATPGVGKGARENENGAKDGVRTRDLLLGKEMLYQPELLSLSERLSAAVCAAAACASAEGQNRTDDTSVFSAVLYLLSYLGRCMYLNDSAARCQVLGGELGPPGFCLGSASYFVVGSDTAFRLVLGLADAADSPS